MKITGKYKGCLPEILHSPAEFAIAGKPFTVAAACRRAANGEVPETLVLHLNAEEKLKMTPVDSLSTEKTDFEIYTVEIPAEKVCGDCITYIIASQEVLTAITDKAEVKVIDESTLPPQPPLKVTEVFGRPRGKNFTKYIEVINPTDKDVDLYDYEFLFWEKETSPKGEPTGRMPMADSAGSEILHPCEYAAIWGIRARNFPPMKSFDTVDKFWKVFNSDLLYKDAGLTAADGRIVPVKYYTEDEQGNKTDVAPDMPERCDSCYLCIVPRGENADKAVFSMAMSTVYANWDTPTKRSSYWGSSVFEPSKGINLCHSDYATPGFPGRGQGRPDLYAPRAIIIPVSPDEKVYIGDGCIDISFACVPIDSEMPVRDAWAELKIEGKTQRINAYEEKDGLWHACVPLETAERLNTLEYTLSCNDGTATVKTAFACTLPVYDNAGPRITGSKPSDGYAYDIGSDSTVRIEYYDISGIDVSRCSLEIDGRDITSKTDFYEDCLRYIPEDGLFTAGAHSLDLKLCDTLGNVSRKHIEYSVSDMKLLNVYLGEVHAHTSDSDGSGRPEDAYEYAKEVGKVDYFAVTDHSHYLDQRFLNQQYKETEKFNEPGKFAAINGWEMTWNHMCGYWGHLNILNLKDVVNCIEENNMPQIFSYLESHPEAVAMFNHPGYKWGNFDEFGHYTEGADKSVCLAEIKGPEYDIEYSRMLSKGWHASPVSNEDNHNPNWTTATVMYGCALAPALTRENILDAFRARRTYTTSDRDMKILYKVNGAWLGSRLDNPETLKFDISISTTNVRGIGKIEIVAEDNIVVAVKDASLRREIVWKPVLSPDFDYYYIRITGNGQYCLTSPVWIENRPKIDITNIEYNASFNDIDSAAVSVYLKNCTAEKIKDVRIKYYLSPMNGFRIDDSEPFCTVCSGSMDADGTLKVSRLLPEVAQNRRVSIVVTAKSGKKKLCATKYVMISPVTITSVVADSGKIGTKAEGEKNLYPYVTLYNSSVNSISLKGGTLGYWTKVGKLPFEENVMATDEITLPGRTSVVIWSRSNPSLTVADFNNAYGTSLEENVNLFVTDVKIVDGSVYGRRLELTLNGEVISRVHWNYALGCEKVKKSEVERKFVYRPNMTLTSELLCEGTPEPGTLTEEQMRRQFTVLVKRREKKQAKKSENKDGKAEKRRQNLKFTNNEGTAVAVGAATAAAAFTAAVTALFRKNKKD